MGQEQHNTVKGKWEQLSEKERYKIEALYRQGLTPADIGRTLEPARDRRTIEREITRGLTAQRDSQWRERRVYLADVGQRTHDERAANKGRGLKIGSDHALAKYLEEKIGKEKWSPDAAIGNIREEGLQFDVSLCTKTVYNMIDSGIFLNLSNKDLPIKRGKKKRAYKKVSRVALNNIKGRSIEERPAEVEMREEYGHWEMDCVVGSGRACLLVMTERMSRQERIFKIASKTQEAVISVLNGLERKYKSNFSKIFQTITMDNGSEFLDTQSMESSCIKPNRKRTNCYYAHPYSAFERGSNETANRLIRRFVPKGSNIDKFSKADVKRIENWINNYPRRIFNYKTANHIVA
jgi:IS30 family transposase